MATQHRIQNSYSESTLTIQKDNIKDYVFFLGNTGLNGVSFPKVDLVKALREIGLTAEDFKAPTGEDVIRDFAVGTVFAIKRAVYVKRGSDKISVVGFSSSEPLETFRSVEPTEIKILGEV